MGCPHWKEVVMVYCDALPVRKLIPADRVALAGHCSCGDFQDCPIYLEAVARLKRASEQESSGSAVGAVAGKEQP